MKVSAWYERRNAPFLRIYSHLGVNTNRRGRMNSALQKNGGALRAAVMMSPP
jgi:hypothetical protein